MAGRCHRQPSSSRGKLVRSVHRRPILRLAAAGLAISGLGLTPALAATAPQAGATITYSLQANGSVEEAWLTGAGAGDAVMLLQNGSPVVNQANPGTADSLGSLIIRNLTPGSGYSWDDTTIN